MLPSPILPPPMLPSPTQPPPMLLPPTLLPLLLLRHPPDPHPPCTHHWEMNFEPNGTAVTGKCEVNSSELVLTSSTVTIKFTFTNDTKKFHLHALNVTGKTSSGVEFSVANTNLSLWEAAVGSSYMCNKEQNYTISADLSIYTFELRVQPLAVKKGIFGTAHECSLDDTSILIPIIVGAALAGLILIVVIAYMIAGVTIIYFGSSVTRRSPLCSLHSRLAEDCQADADSFLVPIAVGVSLLVLILIVLLAYFIGRKRNMTECFLDSDLSFLVPIAVGVALSFLIILVLISYLIGRRKSRTGYQS
ncbi:hypothetical protein F7725_010407, partial [Dissostichus mawsoni]